MRPGLWIGDGGGILRSDTADQHAVSPRAAVAGMAMTRAMTGRRLKRLLGAQDCISRVSCLFFY
jgi:hypothetical protein